MENKIWIIKYRCNGISGLLRMQWPDKPEPNRVALWVLEALSLNEWADVPWGHPAPNCYKLDAQGVVVEAVEAESVPVS